MASLENLNLQQTIEGMPLTFNPEPAAGVNASIQFNVTGGEPGFYYLTISNMECQYHEGKNDKPTLTITTPSEVWLSISHGKTSGQDALLQGLYTADGDLNLLLKMDSLFGSVSNASYIAPPDQRPPGPIALSGMGWLTVAFVPWIIHWSIFDIPGLGYWIKVGLPLLLSALIVAYRKIFDKPTFMELGGFGFFLFSSGLCLIGIEGYGDWGSILSNITIGGLWLSSLIFRKTPLSSEYSKWGFIKALWNNSLFIYPNMVISLMWGWQYIFSTGLGISAIIFPENMIIFTIARYLLLIPAFIFTSVYQKRVPILNPRFNTDQLRSWAWIGLAIYSGLLLGVLIFGFGNIF